MFQKIKSVFSGKYKVIAQMQEKRPLPLGMTEFDVWSDRIIEGARIPADKDSQKFALADMILHLNATEDHKEDGYFIKVLRKVAVNQIADAKRRAIKEMVDTRLKAASAAQQDAEVTATNDGVTDVLENSSV